MRFGPLLVLVVCCLLAGCVVPFADDPATATSSGDDRPTNATATTPPPEGATATAPSTPSTATPDQTPPPDLSADNPFGQQIVPVWVNDTVEDGRNTTALVETSIDYWNARIDRYTAFDYRFEHTRDRSEARVEVRLVDDIEECGRDHDARTVGCAPLLEEGRNAPQTALVEAELHGSNSAVVGTIEHELGHVLGLRHDDEPLLRMGQLSETPVRNASERAVPWYTNDLSVYVDHESIDGGRQEISDQVGHALSYYNDGAEGTIPTNVTFTRTEHEASADVVVTNDGKYDCGGLSGRSAGMKYWNAVIDTDPAPEIYTRLVICVDVDEDAVGWHVGNWLGQGMGLTEPELAPPFRTDDPRDPRSDWWESG